MFLYVKTGDETEPVRFVFCSLLYFLVKFNVFNIVHVFLYTCTCPKYSKSI